MNGFLLNAPRFLFFTGKGGVGKTTLACASAVALAGMERRVLLISTDPASNLDEVLETELGQTPLPIHGVPNLDAMNIDPEAAAKEYRERIVGPYRGVLPDASVASIEEQLSGACTVEIASFNEFARLIGDEAAIKGYDHVILDTAPTGHTLRLLSLPAAWNDFIADNKTGSSCLGPLAGLKEQRATYEKAVGVLNDPQRTLLVLVSRAEESALKEATRASSDLATLGMKNQFLIVNGVFHTTDKNDPVALAFEQRGKTALAGMPAPLRDLPRLQTGFKAKGCIGLAALRTAFDSQVPTNGYSKIKHNLDLPEYPKLDELIEKISLTRTGAVMTMGKGGVGKTTLAAAIAVGLADRGHTVHLTTTDPAAHIEEALSGTHGNLTVGRIDPAAETRAHVKNVLIAAKGKLDAEALELLEEELRSPCTEEVAVFQSFAREIARGQDGFVVLDTAPTGHTLLLLDATEAYHREVLRSNSELSSEVRQLLPRLRDPDFTRIFLITLPEATPVHEAAQLQADLRRAHIEPFAWVINQSFAATGSKDPGLMEKAESELRYINEVVQQHATKIAIVPWLAVEPRGSANLRNIFSIRNQRLEASASTVF